MTLESSYLSAIAREVAEPYISQTQARVVLLTGSVATGEADVYSDIDLVAYYDELPETSKLEEARDGIRRIGGTLVRSTPSDQIVLRGVECQIAFITVETWERQMARILEEFDTTSPLQKAIDGMLHGVALYGTEIIAEWQRRASAYPDGLAHAMVEAHLLFFPVWRFIDRLATRDATLWYYETLVETCQHLLGVLAGLNRRYFSKFQFKRMHAFVDQMAVAPVNLADRIDRLFTAPLNVAIVDIERLVSETVTLVESHMPEIDTTPIRAELGERDQPWSLPSGWLG